ncbi:family 16 glycosylhydrolase [Hyphomonas sp.]|uniref:family 16 glycosylhydrolase n=1 Tax=Hyphomonas sp. TaxID=87 RepID=UPI000ACC1A77|nr:family 16 glycosylhydrolase [Hyphomonas sp.]
MARSGKVRTFEVWRISVFALIAVVVLAGLAALMTPPWEDAARLPKNVSNLPDRKLAGSFVHHFGGPRDEAEWYKSDFYYPNSDHPAWKADLIHFKQDRIELEVRRQRTAYKKIAGAEYQRRGFHHFGRYEVVMQAAPGSGTVSAMFTHTHQQFGDPHDEIDIEFLGKDLTRLHANYFTNGQQLGGIYIPLGFDASKEVHLYAFEWEPDEIRWYVDDRLAYTATPADMPIPQAPGRLMLHLWSGGRDQVGWHGKPTFKDGARAKYYCLSYQAAGDETRQCSDAFNFSRHDN